VAGSRASTPGGSSSGSKPRPGCPSFTRTLSAARFVTLALDEGASLRDAQDAARHADPRTSRLYDRNRNNLDRHPTHRLLTALEP
jgi:hypothetical protein